MESGLPMQLLIGAIVLLLMLTGFGILSAVLNYHWAHYEMDSRRRRRARRIYFAGAGGLMLFMFGAFLSLL